MGDRKRTREMNRMIDTYLDELPGNRRTLSSYLGDLIPKKGKRAAGGPEQQASQPEEAPDEEPEEAPQQDTAIQAIGKPSFMEKVRQMFMPARGGPAAKGSLEGMEVVDLPLPEEKLVEEEKEEEEMAPRLEQRGCCGIRAWWDSLFGKGKDDLVSTEDDARVTRLVLYKDRTEKEIRFLLKLMDSLYPRVFRRTREDFEKSQDFQIYRKIRERYVVEEK